MSDKELTEKLEKLNLFAKDREDWILEVIHDILKELADRSRKDRK